MALAVSHTRHHLRLALLGALLSGNGSACGEDAPGTAAGSPGHDSDLGGGAAPFPRDAGAASDGAAGQPTDEEQRLRLMHAVGNLDTLQICHAQRGLDAGADASLAAVELGVLPGFGSVVFQAPSLGSSSGGVLTLHRVQEADADAAVDAAIPGPCAEETREAELALEPPSTTADAGILDTSERASVFVAGVALDEARLAARLETVHAAYLEEHPGDEAGAAQAAEDARTALTRTLGPQLTWSQDVLPANSSTIRLSLAHLVPDVPSNTGSPGKVRVCITTGTLINPVQPEPQEEGVAFRERRPLKGPYAPGASYAFRVFAAEAFDAAGQDCATVGLQPLSELEVVATHFQPGRAYTLAFAGAVAPDALCAPGMDSLARASCSVPPEQLAARLLVLDD